MRTSLAKQIDWLEYSCDQAHNLPTGYGEWKKKHYDVMESLSARFARDKDFLVRKLFRALDDAEFMSQGTLIDAVNSAYERK